MKVVPTRDMGMCFGVRRAIRISLETDSPWDATIYGELVHNQEVLNELAGMGFCMCREDERPKIPDTPKVLITAHGIGILEREMLEHAGKILIDTTCPLVMRVHEAAHSLHERGCHVVVIGKPDHVEVKGIVEGLTRFDVVPSLDRVTTYMCNKIGIVCQTTSSPEVAEGIVAEIRKRNPGKEIEYVPTICRVTRDREGGVIWLLHQTDAIVVVGGRNSNNSCKLAELARSGGKPCVHIRTALDLDPEWAASFEIIGLTAGTSTPDWVIEEVYAKLVRIRSRRKRTEAESRVVAKAL